MKFKNIIFGILIILLMIILIINPKIASDGAAKGLLLCFKVIIPSLFPFTVLSLMLKKSGILFKGGYFSLFVISVLSGYPVGAKIISDMYKKGEIEKSTANKLQCFCFGSGPAFIVSVIGGQIFKSKKLGFILLFSHIFSAVILFAVFRLIIKEKPQRKYFVSSLSEIFVTSTYEATQTMINLTSFIVLFSVFNGFIFSIKGKFAILEFLLKINEISNAVTLTKNPAEISFLLGFGGVCVWLQIFSVSGKTGVNIPLFAISRILHGAISFLITKLLILIFKINIQTLSNTKNQTVYLNSNPLLISVSLTIMVLLLLFELKMIKKGGKSIKDIV